MIVFDVVGLPIAQGSKKHVGNGVMIESAHGLGDWRNQVADTARQHAPDQPYDGPLELTCAFRFPMPKSRRKADRLAGIRWKDTKPDIDKLIRSICDSLTAAAIIRDDARIVAVHALKHEIHDGWHGVTITIDEAP